MLDADIRHTEASADEIPRGGTAVPEESAWLQFRRPQLPAEVPGAGRAEVRDEGPAPSCPMNDF